MVYQERSTRECVYRRSHVWMSLCNYSFQRVHIARPPLALRYSDKSDELHRNELRWRSRRAYPCGSLHLSETCLQPVVLVVGVCIRSVVEWWIAF